jgi:hypothetical protein
VAAVKQPAAGVDHRAAEVAGGAGEPQRGADIGVPNDVGDQFTDEDCGIIINPMVVTATSANDCMIGST